MTSGICGFNISRQRLYASLLILGAAFLFFRTIMLIAQGSLSVFVLWVAVLLIAESLIDLGCVVSSLSWWIRDDETRASVPLRFAAAVIIVHAVRVLIFVLGRIGPWVNCDVRPEYRALHDTRWTWFGVYFAAVMSALSIIVLIVIWRVRRHVQRKRTVYKTAG
jgi:hypothetical protein